MKIRTKMFSITGVVFLSVIVISSLSVWTMNETARLRNTIEGGAELIGRARSLHSLMKDLMFDIFTPQTYRLLKDIIHTPRFNTTLRTFKTAVTDFQSAFHDFMDSPRVKSLLRDEEVRDAYEVAKIMNVKALERIASLEQSLDELVKTGVLGEESIYKQLQMNQEAAIPAFFDQVRDTSYYLSNSFESFLSHFISSLQEEGAVINRQILVLFWVLTLLIGLFAAVLSLTFAGRISRRIQVVEEAVHRISRGDFTAQLDIPTRDEFGLLSRNFNLFIKDLKRNVDSVLNLMRDVGDSITDQPNFDRILRLIVEAAVNDANVDGAAVLMGGDGGLCGEYALGRLSVQQAAGAFPLDTATGPGSPLYEVYEKGRPWFLRQAGEDQRVSSLMAIPLTVSKRTLGVLCLVTVDPRGRLTDLDYTNFCTFADYAALIIDNYFKYGELLEKRQAEYRALQSQIQPHFLYNVLNGLIGLNRLGDRRNLENAIFCLKDMLRYTLEQGEWTTVAEELQFLDKYCALQKLRFQERLAVRISCTEDAAGCRIPKLLLQPLVENSIIHGLEPLGSAGKLVVSARRRRRNGSRALVLFVGDNGIGFDPRAGRDGMRIGLSNVRQRLLMAFPQASLSIRSKPGAGTRVRIEIAAEQLRS